MSSNIHHSSDQLYLFTFLLFTHHYNITTESYQPPNDIRLKNVNSSQLTFQWSPVSSTCHAIHYLISASNCGHCPNITSHAMATCAGMFRGIQVCSFTVQTVVCDNITGNESGEVMAMLRGT